MLKEYRFKYGGALISQEEKDAINRVIDKNWWPLGEEGIMMEQEAADYLGVKHCVLANSGSSAGLLALSALELPKGSEVIIPAVTFPTIFNIILQCGLKPVVADCEIGTYNLNLNEVKKLITKKTRAIIAVHAVGNPVDMLALRKIVEPYNKSTINGVSFWKAGGDKRIYLIEDNCDGWGGDIYGGGGSGKVGSFGDVSFTSFHAAHIVAMGQGGGVFTDDDTIARNAKMYRDWGRQADIEGRTNEKWPDLPKSQDPRFIYEKIGYNLSPLELQAAMGRVQLKKTEEIKAKRKKNFHYLCQRLSFYPELIMPAWIEGASPSWFALPLTYTGDRGALLKHLEENGIETRSMFAGNILKHPAYKGMKIRHGDLTEANIILEKSFWIGVHPRYNEEDLDNVVGVFADFFDATLT